MGAGLAYLKERRNRSTMVQEAEALTREQQPTDLSESVLSNTKTTRRGTVLAKLTKDIVREARIVRLEVAVGNLRRHNTLRK